uniref:hypothetical protein n=1 Tax=Escherichia coli TaxID=562 RepID=UPI001BDB895C
MQFNYSNASYLGEFTISSSSDAGCISEDKAFRFSYFPGFAPIFPDICYHLTHYKPAAADIPVASDNPAHYADAIRYNAR